MLIASEGGLWFEARKMVRLFINHIILFIDSILIMLDLKTIMVFIIYVLECIDETHNLNTQHL